MAALRDVVLGGADVAIQIEVKITSLARDISNDAADFESLGDVELADLAQEMATDLEAFGEDFADEHPDQDEALTAYVAFATGLIDRLPTGLCDEELAA